MTMCDKKKHHETRPKCIVCKKFLKVFETNLCSCELNVCMKHKQRIEHACPDVGGVQEMAKIVAPKVVKI